MRFTLKKHNKPSGSILALFCVMTIALSACQTPPLRSINKKELANRYPAFLRSYQSELDAISEKSSKRIEHEYRKASLSGENKQQTYDMLVLSGGGAFGAFGAGFLKGWGKVSKTDYTRPQFDSVSGTSTGSLLAPFAFIGTPEAYDSILNFYQKPGADWARKRGIIPYLRNSSSIALIFVENVGSFSKLKIIGLDQRFLNMGAYDTRRLRGPRCYLCQLSMEKR